MSDLTVFFYGVLGASSLAIGAVVGVVAKLSKNVTAAIMAFASGTLLSAIAFEITWNVYQKSNFVFLLLGFLLGGFIFITITQYVDEHGGFLRQQASSRRYLLEHPAVPTKKSDNILDNIGKIEAIEHIPSTEKEFLAQHLKVISIEAETVICEEGDIGDFFYLIVRGQAEVTRHGQLITTLKEGDIFGEMSLLTGEPRSATVSAKTSMQLYKLDKDNFSQTLRTSPHLAWALSRNLARRLKSETDSRVVAEKNLAHWRQQLLEQVEADKLLTDNPITLQNLVQSSAPLAILVGTLLDNIPESVVIGINASSSQFRWSFLIAVFISNFPEALSSAAGMKQAGTKVQNILLLWFGIVILSGFFALSGTYIHQIVSESLIAFIEAFAGGAILAMLASTMMPEAYELGGSSIAYSTIIGFLLSFLITSFSL